MKKYLSTINRKNILITGGSGFIGQHLNRYLGCKYNIFNIIRSNKYSSAISNPIVLDLLDSSRTAKFFEKNRKDFKFDVIIHLASVFADTKNSRDINVLYDNLKIAESVIKIAQIMKPKKIINFSSIAVYPNQDGIFTESSQVRTSINSECLYGLSKFCIENILDFMLKNKNIIISHLRLAQVYGEGARKDRIFSIMLRELKNNNSITVLGDGKRISNFIQIAELTDIIDRFIISDFNGIYNVGGKNLSYLAFAEKLIKDYGNRNSRIIKKKDGSRSKCLLDTTKLKDIYRK